jgi:hypothetical protein
MTRNEVKVHNSFLLMRSTKTKPQTWHVMRDARGLLIRLQTDLLARNIVGCRMYLRDRRQNDSAALERHLQVATMPFSFAPRNQPAKLICCESEVGHIIVRLE